MVYPADWRKDPELQSCGILARGVWWELLCLMHECEPYGHLSRNGLAMPDAAVASLIRVRLDAYTRATRELESAGVLSRSNSGVIFSRRMVRDERLRLIRAASGKLGGNPTLLKQKDKQNGSGSDDLLNHASKQVPTPSFAFAVAPSGLGSVSENLERRGVRGKAAPATRLPKPWELPESWLAWAVGIHHLEPDRVVRISLAFRDYWWAKAGADAAKVDWEATWRNWIRKEVGDA